jgi:bile acid-coenzyme A ligase
MSDDLWTISRTMGELAEQKPSEAVLVCAKEDGTDDVLSRAELESWTNRFARHLAVRGVKQGSFVAIILPTCVEHFVASLAAHKLGACPMPVNVRMPAAERDALIELGRPVAIIADAPELDGINRTEMAGLLSNTPAYPDTPPPDTLPQPAKAVASGGSTGKPKLIVSPGAFAYPRRNHPLGLILRLEEGDMMYSPGPLYHNAPFLFSLITLFQGGRVLINERFHAERCLDLVEKYRPTVLNLVPTMMQRMLRVPGIERRDLRSVRLMWHLAAPCPAWAKEAWIDLIGPDRVWELWAATEITGCTTISGPDWLAHRGSVGKGNMTEIRILDPEGKPCPTGQTGEIWTRFAGGPPQYFYMGAAPLPVTGDGFSFVGDLGYVDEEGYMYLSDRRVDMIISGGANIYPAEIEAVLTSHPGVRDAAVIGLKDDDLGRRVHAIVEPMDAENPPDPAELDRLCRDQLSGYKSPRSYEFLEKLPRNQAGKIRRSSLRDERDARAAH